MTNDSKCTECEKKEVCKFIHEYCNIVDEVAKKLENPIVIANVRCRYFKQFNATIKRDL